MEQLECILAVMVLIRVVYTDLLENKIRNLDIFIGLSIGIYLNILKGGCTELLMDIKYVGFTFLILLPVFIIKGIGAGDIKLLMFLGLIMNEKIFEIIIVSFFIGSVIGIIKIMIKFLEKEKINIRKEKIKFSIPIGLSFLLFMIWRG